MGVCVCVLKMNNISIFKRNVKKGGGGTYWRVEIQSVLNWTRPLAPIWSKIIPQLSGSSCVDGQHMSKGDLMTMSVLFSVN